MNAYQQFNWGSEDDHLLSIFRYNFLTWFSVENTRKILFFKWFTLQFMSVLGSIEIYNGSPDGYRKYAPFLILQQPTAMMYLMAAMLCDKCQDYSRLIKMQTWSWTLADDQTYKKMTSQGKYVKICCCVITCMNMITLVLSAPLLGDESEWQIQTFMSKKYLYGWMHVIFVILFLGLMLAMGIYFSSIFCLCLYGICHMKFQFQILNSFIRRLHTISVYHVNDVRYQERVAVHLKCCIKIHVGILRLIKTLTDNTGPIFLSLILYGLAIYIFSAYFLMTDLSPRSNFRIYIYIIGVCIVHWILCEYCQRFTNESEEVFFSACKCPWEQFNNRNRRTLLMLLLNTSTPSTVSCYGILHANHKLIVTMWRMAYSVCTVFTNLN